MQPLWLLALMESADRVPNKSTRSFLAWPIPGFPDRRSRSFRINVVITPAVHERHTDNFILRSTSSFLCRRDPRRSIGSAVGQSRPGHTRHLVGKRDRNNLERSSAEKLCEPGILLRLLSRQFQYRAGSDHQDASQIAIALFRDWPELLLPAC